MRVEWQLMENRDSWPSSGLMMQRGEEDRWLNQGRDSFCSVPAQMELNTGNQCYGTVTYRNFLTSGTGTVTCKKVCTGTVINYGSETGTRYKIMYRI
jgi:hypothetical protein